MNRKQWAILVLSLLLSSLGLIVGAVVLIDPFEVYHKATAFIPPITNGTQIYSNAGIAKSYEYDSVVIGSSMTENFVPSQLDTLLGGRFIKLPINAGSPYNHKQMMDLAFGAQHIRRILYGVDIELMTYFYTMPKCEMPDYLYDDSLLNDVSYWFNQSVLARYIPQCLSTFGQTDPTQRDTMYTWGGMYSYGKEAALAGTAITGETVDQGELHSPAQLSQQTRLNVEYNLLPYIEAHPETEFLFFFPPYSLVQWYRFYQEGALYYHLEQKQALIQCLLPYDNVKVYDFQGRTDWILNLDHYIDASHYGPWINEEIALCISRDEYRVTELSCVSKTQKLLISLTEQLIQAGCWPESFSY